MPKGKKSKKKETGFGIGTGLLIIALVLLVWLVLKTFKLVDPPEELTTYILEAILGIMITAQLAEAWDFRKRSMTQGEAIVEIKTKMQYLEKGFDELKVKTKDK